MVYSRYIFTPILCILIGAGCAKRNASPEMRVSEARAFSEKNYEVGVPSSAYVGEPIVRVKEYQVREIETAMVEASSKFVLEGPRPVSGMKGDRFRVAGEIEYKNETYSAVKIGQNYHLINKDGAPSPHAMNPSGFESGIVMVYDWTPNPPDVRFAKVQNTEISATAEGGYKNYEILFNGINSNSMNFTYREYSKDDLARPAFSQDLTYPTDSRQIRFRNTVISIGSSSPEQITYTVTADATS